MGTYLSHQRCLTSIYLMNLHDQFKKQYGVDSWFKEAVFLALIVFLSLTCIFWQAVSYVLTFQENHRGLLHTCYDVLAHFTINQSYWKQLLTFMICEILNKNRSVHLALLTVMSPKLFVVTCLVAYLFNACFYSCQYSQRETCSTRVYLFMRLPRHKCYIR